MRVLNVAAALLCSVPCLAQAQAFPSRQVTIVVPYQPGGTNDIIARTLAPRLSEGLNAEFVKALRDPQNAPKLESQGLAIIADSPEHFAAYIAAESQKWRKVVTVSGAKAD